MKKIVIAAAAALSFAMPAIADATITIYTDKASYLAAVGTPGTDSFNDLTTDTDFGKSLTRTAGSYGYKVSTVDVLYGAGGGSDIWMSTARAQDPLVFDSFTGGVYGIGGFFFDTNDVLDYVRGNLSFTAVDASGSVTRTLTNATTSSFLGFVSTTGVTSLTVKSVGSGKWPTANDLVLGGSAAAAVPEPATWAMLLLGMGLVGATMRRRRAVPAAA